MEFIKWIPTRVKELQNKSPEEIAMTLNKLSKTPEGQKQLEALIQEFKSENAAIQPEETGMFKKGGKLNYLVSKFQNGGTPRIVETLNYVQGRTSLPPGMTKLDFNRKFSDNYRASQYSNSKGDILQFLQRPNTVGGTERLITNNKRDTLYRNTFNGAETSNKPQPWYRPKSEKAKKKADYDRFTSRFAEYFQNGGKTFENQNGRLSKVYNYKLKK